MGRRDGILQGVRVGLAFNLLEIDPGEKLIQLVFPVTQWHSDLTYNLILEAQGWSQGFPNLKRGIGL